MEPRRGDGPDLLGEPEGEPPAWATAVGRLTERARATAVRVPRPVRALAATLAVLGVVAAGLLAAPEPTLDGVAAPRPSPTRTGVTVPPASRLDAAVRQVVVVGEGGTRVLPTLRTRGVRPADQSLLDLPLRDARQLDTVVVGLAGDRIAAVGGPRRGLVGPLADAWFPAVRGDAAWVVRGDARRGPTTVRRVLVEEDAWGTPGPQRALPARVRAVGELEGGLLVVERASGGAGTRVRYEVLVWDPVAARPVRPVATDARALDVRAGITVWRADPCPDDGACPLYVGGAEGSVPVPETASREFPLRPAGVRLDAAGRHLAYTRQLARETGDPRAATAEVVVVHTSGRRLAVVPASQGTLYEEELTWAGDLLLFVRRLEGPVLAAYDEDSDRVTYGPRLPSLRTVEAVVGVLAPPGDDEDEAEGGDS